MAVYRLLRTSSTENIEACTTVTAEALKKTNSTHPGCAFSDDPVKRVTVEWRALPRKFSTVLVEQIAVGKVNRTRGGQTANDLYT